MKTTEPIFSIGDVPKLPHCKIQERKFDGNNWVYFILNTNNPWGSGWADEDFIIAQIKEVTPHERYRTEDCVGFIEQYRFLDDGKIESQSHKVYANIIHSANKFIEEAITVAIFKIKLKPLIPTT